MVVPKEDKYITKGRHDLTIEMLANWYLKWVFEKHPELLHKKEDSKPTTNQTAIFTKPKKYKKASYR